MIRGGRVVLAGLLLLLGLVACGPVHQTVRPDNNNLGNVKKLAVVMPPEGDFTVFYERAKATATPALMFGLLGAAVASAHNKSQDEELSKAIVPHFAGFSSRSILEDSLRQALIDSGKFSEIQVFEKDLEPGEVSKFDAVLKLQIKGWGLRIVERGQQELMSTFIELELKMIRSSTSQIIWDEHETVIGKNKRTLNSYQNEEEACTKDIRETVEDASLRVASILIYR